MFVDSVKDIKACCCLGVMQQSPVDTLITDICLICFLVIRFDLRENIVYEWEQGFWESKIDKRHEACVLNSKCPRVWDIFCCVCKVYIIDIRYAYNLFFLACTWMDIFKSYFYINSLTPLSKPHGDLV